MTKYQKPFVPCSGILDPKPRDPDGYVSNDGTWAAVPYAEKQKGFVIIHNGNVIHDCNTYKQAIDYISKKSKLDKKKKSISSLEEFL
jgi:hypothetical protein